MSRGNTILLAAVVAIALIAIAAGISFFHGGVSARTAPSRMETMVAREVRHLAIPWEFTKVQNPVPGSPESIHEGMMHFADHCAVCHDNDGRGETMFGHGLYPRPPDLRREDTQKLSDGEMFWIIENGVRFTGMPAFGGEMGSQEDSWKLVRFIRHLPRLTEDERMEMERYNPQGPEDLEEEQEENDFLRGAPLQQKPEGAHHH
jgi:mono/diheme cytochrome c family protein